MMISIIIENLDKSRDMFRRRVHKDDVSMLEFLKHYYDRVMFKVSRKARLQNRVYLDHIESFEYKSYILVARIDEIFDWVLYFGFFDCSFYLIESQKIWPIIVFYFQYICYSNFSNAWYFFYSSIFKFMKLYSYFINFYLIKALRITYKLGIRTSNRT